MDADAEIADATGLMTTAPAVTATDADIAAETGRTATADADTVAAPAIDADSVINTSPSAVTAHVDTMLQEASLTMSAALVVVAAALMEDDAGLIATALAETDADAAIVAEAVTIETPPSSASGADAKGEKPSMASPVVQNKGCKILRAWAWITRPAAKSRKACRRQRIG